MRHQLNDVAPRCIPTLTDHRLGDVMTADGNAGTDTSDVLFRAGEADKPDLNRDPVLSGSDKQSGNRVAAQSRFEGKAEATQDSLFQTSAALFPSRRVCRAGCTAGRALNSPRRFVGVEVVGTSAPDGP